MRVLLLASTIAILAIPAAGQDGSYRPCDKAHFLAFFGLDPDLGHYCGAPALGDPDHIAAVPDEVGEPRPQEPPPHECPYDKKTER